MKELVIKEQLFTITFELPENACVFCKHCSDFFYDYTHGPYLILCKISHPNENGTCKLFEVEK